MFSCEYCEIFKNAYSEEHLPTATSEFTDGFFYLINVKVCLNPDMMVLASWQFLRSERCVRRIENKIWLACENQVDDWRDIVGNMNRFIY